MKTEVAVRDLCEADIPLILNYWYRSPVAFVESMGIDTSKMPTEAQMAQTLNDKIQTNRSLPESKITCVVLVLDGLPFGMHTLFPVHENDFAIMHAHFWTRDLRGRGLGLQTYSQAILLFMRRFNLRRILFKTPKQNIGALRVKEKLGIRVIGEETVVDAGIIRDHTLTTVFEVTRDEAEAWWG